MSNENYTVNEALDCIFQNAKRLESIEKSLKDLSANNTSNQQETPIFIDEACTILGISKPTMYTKISKGDIPHHKQGKRLLFFKSEILDFLRTGRRKTNQEFKEAALNGLKPRK